MSDTAAVLPTTAARSAAAIARRPAPPEIVVEARSDDLMTCPAGTWWATVSTAVLVVARIWSTAAISPHPTMSRTPTAMRALLRRGLVGVMRAVGAAAPLDVGRLRGGMVLVSIGSLSSAVVDRLGFGDADGNRRRALDES